MKKIFLSLIIVIISFSMIYSCSIDFEYNYYVYNEKKIDSLHMSLTQLEEQIHSDYNNLKIKNNDLAGWLNIPNIGYFPVMYTGDQFYLYKDINKKYLVSGSLFMNKESNGLFDGSSIIYGHHMKDGTMFGSLKKYKNKDFFNSNDNVLIYDGFKFKTYQVYSVFLIKDGENIMRYNLPDKEKKSYYESVKNKSLVSCNNDINYQADMLFLQTCDYSFNDARLVVAFQCI